MITTLIQSWIHNICQQGIKAKSIYGFKVYMFVEWCGLIATSDFLVYQKKSATRLFEAQS